MTEDKRNLTEEEIEALYTLEERDGNIPLQAPNPPPSLTSEFISYITGENEIPAEYKREFPHVTAPSLSLMPLESKHDIAQWQIMESISLNIYDVVHPRGKLNPYQRSVIDMFFNKNVQNSLGGFGRTTLTTTTNVIRHQQEGIITPTSKNSKPTIKDRIKNFVSGGSN